MKNIFIVLLLNAVIASTACAQKLDASKVPAPVKTSFAKQYPGVTAKWEMEDGKYEASFKQQGHEISVLYDASGNMTESEMEIEVAELPAAIVDYVKSHRNGASVKEAAKITKTNGEINYEAVVKSMALIFDAKGNFLKEEKD
jgi:hypothetical protein